MKKCVFSIMLLALLFTCSDVFAYTAICYPEYGNKFSPASDKQFEISVENGVLNSIYTVGIPKTGYNKWKVRHYTEYVTRTTQYKIRKKVDDIYCYQHGYNGPDQTYEQMMNWAMICVGKFDENKVFPYSFMLEDINEYGRCVLNKGTLTNSPADSEFPLSEKAKQNGFVAVSNGPMDWDQANAWCEKRGGRLPKINNEESIRYGDVPIVKINEYLKNSAIEGFKKAQIKMAETGLPYPAIYWASTTPTGMHPSSVNDKFVIDCEDEAKLFYTVPKDKPQRVTCVKK